MTQFTTETGATERKNLAEMNSANGGNSTYETIMGALSGLQQANSGKTGAERAVGLGKLGYAVSEAIKWLSAL